MKKSITLISRLILVIFSSGKKIIKDNRRELADLRHVMRIVQFTANKQAAMLKIMQACLLVAEDGWLDVLIHKINKRDLGQLKKVSAALNIVNKHVIDIPNKKTKYLLAEDKEQEQIVQRVAKEIISQIKIILNYAYN